MNKFKNKFLASVLSAAMVVGMFAPMATQAAFITSGDEYFTTQSGLNVKVSAVIDGNNNAYAADFYGDQSSSAGNFADVFDGNGSTGVIFRTDSSSWDGYIQKDDYIQVDFENAIDLSGVDFTFVCPPVANGSNEDGFQDATLEYTTDGENWNVLETYAGVVKAVDFNASEAIKGVKAVRLVNKLEYQHRVWVRLAEINVDGVVAETPDPEPTPDPKPEVCEVFEDVDHDTWYEAAVQYVYDNGIMAGNDGLFNPTGNMTRAQFVTTLYNIEGRPEVTDYSAVDELVDVQAGAWYTDAVCWAYSVGVANGNSDTKMFNMSDSIIRQQLATFFYNYAAFKGLDTETRGEISDMVGAENVSAYAEDTVKWAVGTGLITGSEKTVDGVKVYDLNPRGTATRAQVASILQRFCEANGI